MVDIFNLANLVAVQVENVQFLKILEVSDIFNEIFAKHQYS